MSKISLGFEDTYNELNIRFMYHLRSSYLPYNAKINPNLTLSQAKCISVKLHFSNFAYNQDKPNISNKSGFRPALLAFENEKFSFTVTVG